MNLVTLDIVILLTILTSPAVASQNIVTDCQERGVVSIAHRGGIVSGVPENTLAAFREAINQGADAIEIDLRGTKDGEIVIIHDKTVDRTTNGRGRVIDQTLVELKMLDAGHGERIPTYEEVLTLVAGTGVTLLLDIKKSSELDKSSVIRLTEQHNAVANVIVGTRNIEDLQAFRALNSNLRILGFIRGVDDIEPFVDAGIDIIRLWPKWIYKNPGLIEKLHHHGKPVWTTAGSASREELEKLIKLGVNGILSDQPKLLHSLLTDMAKNCNR